MRYLVVFLIGCAAVTPELTPRTALVVQQIERWEAFYQEPLMRCWTEADQLDWEYVEQETLQKKCLISFYSDGCMYYQVDGPTIILDTTEIKTEAELERLETHELTHWLFVCSEVDKNGDNRHTSRIWRTL
jgi:hypothetical protein